MGLFRMTIKILNWETFCTNDSSDSHFNKGQITQCIVMCATGMY